MDKGKIMLGFDYRCFFDEKKSRGIGPSVMEYTEGYRKNLERIRSLLSVRTIEEILKILSIKKDINFKEIEKLIGISHPAMWEHIDNLEKLNLVVKEKKKLEGERKELKINLHPDVRTIQLPVFEYKEIVERKKDGSKVMDEIVTTNPEILKRMGLPGKQIVDAENTLKIISDYIKKVENRLKASNIPKPQEKQKQK